VVIVIIIIQINGGFTAAMPSPNFSRHFYMLPHFINAFKIKLRDSDWCLFKLSNL